MFGALLHHALKSHHRDSVKVAQFLIDSGADVDHVYYNTFNEMDEKVCSICFNKLKLLTTITVCIIFVHKNGHTPIYLLVYDPKGSVIFLDLLLSAGANIDSKYKVG